MMELADFVGTGGAALVCGAVGLVCQLSWPLMRSRNAILAVQFGIGAGYGAQYALLEAWCGAGICLMGASQTTLALMAGERPWLRQIGLGFLPLVWASGLVTWGGVSSLFALTACSLTMLGRLQKDTLMLRAFLLGAAPFGISYDLSVGAPIALCGALISAGLAATMLARELRLRRSAGELEYFAAAGQLV